MDNAAPITNTTLIAEAENALSDSFKYLFTSGAMHATGSAARVVASAYALSVLRGTPVSPPALPGSTETS